MTRRTALLTLLPLGTSGAAYARFVEPNWLKVTFRECPLPGMAPDGRIRVAHLSDLHASRCVPNSLIENAVELALSQRPDMVCLTGDFVTAPGGGYDRRWYEKLLSRLARQVPTYASMGNHDGGAWLCGGSSRADSSDLVRKMVGGTGVQVLHNQQQRVTVRNQVIRLVGLGDLWACELDPAAAFGRLNGPAVEPTVLLSHNPDSKTDAAGYPWHLMLSGHTHGGQVVMPVVGLCPAPVQDRRYIYGLLPWRDRLIHVTSGIGNVQGVRFNCRPEVAILDLIPQTQSPAPEADRSYS